MIKQVVPEILKLMHRTLLSGHQKGNPKDGAKEQNNYLLPVSLAKIKPIACWGHLWILWALKLAS